MMTIIELPFYPVSVNQYWRHAGNRTYIGKPGVIFRKKVIDICHRFNHIAPLGRLEVHIHLYAPDKRIRDLDNYQKSLCDALTHAKVWADDSLIDVLTTKRMQNVKHGMTRIFITSIPEKHNEKYANDYTGNLLAETVQTRFSHAPRNRKVIKPAQADRHEF